MGVWVDCERTVVEVRFLGLRIMCGAVRGALGGLVS